MLKIEIFDSSISTKLRLDVLENNIRVPEAFMKECGRLSDL